MPKDAKSQEGKTKREAKRKTKPGVPNHYVLDGDQHDAFTKVLTNPPGPNERLRRLMATPHTDDPTREDLTDAVLRREDVHKTLSGMHDLLFEHIAYGYEQAARALAFGLHTASVFHGVRCLERCIAEAQAQLGLSRLGSPPLLLKDLKYEGQTAVAFLLERSHFVDDLQAFLVKLDEVGGTLRDAQMHLKHRYDGDAATEALATLRRLLFK